VQRPAASCYDLADRYQSNGKRCALAATFQKERKTTIIEQQRKAIEVNGSEHVVSQATGVDTGVRSRFTRDER
jgi:hypothetical protein